jgi:hypothetical protein
MDLLTLCDNCSPKHTILSHDSLFLWSVLTLLKYTSPTPTSMFPAHPMPDNLLIIPFPYSSKVSSEILSPTYTFAAPILSLRQTELLFCLSSFLLPTVLNTASIVVELVSLLPEA